MLRPRMTVQRRDGTLVYLQGRNAGMLSVWWGYPVRDGKPDRGHIRTVKETDCAVMTEDGPRYPLLIPT